MAALIVAYCNCAARLLRKREARNGKRSSTPGRKDARVVVSIPTSAELRKEFESGFKKAFPGIELELNVARGSSNINKIAEEQNAGVQGIDVHMGGTTSIITGLLAQNFLEPVMPSMVLPEVKDPSIGGAATSGRTTPRSSSTVSLPT